MILFLPVIFTAVAGFPTLYALDALGVVNDGNGGWIGLGVGFGYLTLGWALLLWWEFSR